MSKISANPKGIFIRWNIDYYLQYQTQSDNSLQIYYPGLDVLGTFPRMFLFANVTNDYKKELYSILFNHYYIASCLTLPCIPYTK